MAWTNGVLIHLLVGTEVQMPISRGFRHAPRISLSKTPVRAYATNRNLVSFFNFSYPSF